MTVSANIKLLRLEMETLTHNGAQCGHVPYYPSSIAIQGLGDSPGKEGSMRLLFSELEISECDHNSRAYGCLVEEHPFEYYMIPELLFLHMPRAYTPPTPRPLKPPPTLENKERSKGRRCRKADG